MLHLAGDWYIVACPRASTPFDDAQQATDYPSHHTTMMVQLGLDLIASADSWNYKLRVGMACGPVAGAVIGTLRAFYCLYGDTVNTAARMCKYATQGRILCTDDFATMARACVPLHRTTIQDRGILEIKGKGLMQIWEISDTPDNSVRPLAVIVDAVPNEIEDPTDTAECFAETWLKDPVRSIQAPRLNFADPLTEAQFQGAVAPSRRRLLTAGLTLNALAAALEWRMGGAASDGSRGSTRGDPVAALDWPEGTGPKIEALNTLLSVHWGVSWIVTLALLYIVWSATEIRTSIRFCSRAFVVLLTTHLCLASMASRCLPMGGGPWSWVLVFATGMCLISGWLGPLSVVGASILSTVALITFIGSLIIAQIDIRAARATESALMVALAFGVVSSCAVAPLVVLR